MPAEYICFYSACLYSMFLAKKCVCYYCKLIKSNVYKKYSITARELVLTILDRSVGCVFDNTKALTLLSVIRRNDRHNYFPEIV